MKKLFIILMLSLSLNLDCHAMETAEEYEINSDTKKSIPETFAQLDVQLFVQKAKKRFDLKKEPMPSDVEIKEKYEEQLKLYQGYEAELEKGQEKLCPKLLDCLNYGMTWHKIQQKIKEKFKALKDKGLIVSVQEFEKIKYAYFSTPTKDLVRMWGADYLKKKINELGLHDKYDVPEYIIVAGDPDNLLMNLCFCFDMTHPLPNSLLDACIYFKRIIGEPYARNGYAEGIFDDIGCDSEIGFYDFGDSGNIRIDAETGKYFIIDTEHNSFKFSLDEKFPEIFRYAVRKFLYLNDIPSQLFNKYNLNLRD